MNSVIMLGISAVHKEYEFLSAQEPTCLELHLKMIWIENMQPDMNARLIRKCYDTACAQFGKDNSGG